MYTKVKTFMDDYPSSESLTTKQKQILEAALELFSEKGYTATTTSDIAKKAHTSEKTLFKYYPTKQILFNSIFYPCITNMLENKQHLETFTAYTFNDFIQLFFSKKIALCNENPELFKLLLHQFISDPVFQKVVSTNWQEIYSPLLASYMHLSEEAHAQYADIFPHSISRIILSLLIGYCMTKNLLTASPTDDEREIQLMLSILSNGINGLEK